MLLFRGFFWVPKGSHSVGPWVQKNRKAHSNSKFGAVNVVRVRVAVLPHFGAEWNSSPSTFCKFLTVLFGNFFVCLLAVNCLP